MCLYLKVQSQALFLTTMYWAQHHINCKIVITKQQQMFSELIHSNTISRVQLRTRSRKRLSTSLHRQQVLTRTKPLMLLQILEKGKQITRIVGLFAAGNKAVHGGSTVRSTVEFPGYASNGRGSDC